MGEFTKTAKLVLTLVSIAAIVLGVLGSICGYAVGQATTKYTAETATQKVEAVEREVKEIKSQFGALQSDVAAVKASKEADTARMARIEHSIDQLNAKTDRVLERLGRMQ